MIESLDAVNQFLALQATHYELECKTVSRVRLVAEEVFVNIVSHGLPEGSKEQITLTFKKEAAHISLEFRDCGIAYEPNLTERSNKNKMMDTMVSEGGHGLTLVETITSEFSVSRHNGCNHTKMRIPVSKNWELKS